LNTLSHLPADARPREKLLARGPGALADAELLALLLRTGLPGQGVLKLAESLLERFDGLAGLLHADVNALKDVKGLGPAKRAEVAAVLEIARRVLSQQLTERPLLDAPQRVKDFVALQLRPLEHEVFAVLFLDTHLRLLKYEVLFSGTLTHTSVHPREIVKRALACNAAAVLLAHNHPSGVAEPSRADELLTQGLRAALQLVDVRVVDHLIVGAASVLSFAERGLL
jgi:DNA repair protein RadC